MDAINLYLKTEAMKRGLCEEWTNAWSEGYSTEELITRFIEGLDFCIAHNYPSVEFIKEHFDVEKLRQNGIFADDADIADGNRSGSFVVMGESYGEMGFSGYDAATVWVRHDSELLVTATDHAFVMVHVYDRAKVRVEEGSRARVIVRKHSPECEVVKI